MGIIKRKTVGNKTIRLHQAKTEKSGKQYEYYVTDDTDSLPLTAPVYTKEEGMNQFRQEVTEADKELAESKGQKSFGGKNESRSSGPRLPGMGGGSSGGSPSVPDIGGGGGRSNGDSAGPMIPGFGPMDDDDDDDDDEPGLPFF